MTRRVGDRVKNWITINEPFVAGFLGYWFGIHAPGETDRAGGLAAVHNLLRMHGTGVDIVQDTVSDARVGITLNLTSVYTQFDSEEDEREVAHHDGLSNRWFLDPVFKGQYPDDMLETFGDDAPDVQSGDMELISRSTDFLGVNYYTPTYVKAGVENPFGDQTIAPDGERTAMGWLVEPSGLRDLLVRIKDDYAPGALYITENGAAFDDPSPVDGRVHDPRRIAYYQGHLSACLEAIDQGVPLVGYFAWSLLDNFEWAEGYAKRFGIVHVDYSTQTRTLKDSARWYSNVIKANRILDDGETD
jgi:beta-glucosidase